MTSIYLGELQFPLPPEALTLEQQAGHRRVTLTELGEVTQLCAPGQVQFSFEGCFPLGNAPSPEEGAAALKAMLGKKTVRFVAAGISNPVSMQVTVEKLRLWEEAGDCGTVYFALTLREYRSPQVKTTVAASGGTVTAVERADTREVPVSCTVVRGDTLWAIARRYLGDGSRYPELAKKNGIQNPNLIYPGQVITI